MSIEYQVGAYALDVIQSGTNSVQLFIQVVKREEEPFFQALEIVFKKREFVIFKQSKLYV